MNNDQSKDYAALLGTVQALSEEFWSLHGRVVSRTELFVQLIEDVSRLHNDPATYLADFAERARDRARSPQVVISRVDARSQKERLEALEEILKLLILRSKQPPGA